MICLGRVQFLFLILIFIEKLIKNNTSLIYYEFVRSIGECRIFLMVKYVKYILYVPYTF